MTVHDHSDASPEPPTEAAPAGTSTADTFPSEAVASDRRPETGASPTAPGEGRLVAEDAVMDFQARWEAIQQGFVDNPRTAVTEADTLVADVLQRLSATFENQHQELESQWSDGEPSTEDLRGALQRYRDFFDRLLAI